MGGYERSDTGEILTDPAQIAAMCRQIIEARALVTVAIPGVEGRFISALLDVNADARYLLMDELTPAPGHAQLILHKRLQAMIKYHGIEVRFKAELEAAGGQSGIAFYRMILPTELHYLQRRAHFRVRLGYGLTVPVSLSLDEAHHLEGRLSDLSAGGIGAELPDGMRLEQGQVVHDCQIKLADDKFIDGEVEVRYIKQDTQSHHQHLGARFLSLTPKQQNTLRRFIKEIEREMLRRLPRDH
jgi:c-di-GMP-binding flagellar brake protein YcgR